MSAKSSSGEAAELGDVRLGRATEDVDGGHQGGDADADQRPVQDDAGRRPRRRWPLRSAGGARSPAISPASMKRRAAGQHDAPEGRDREQGERTGQEQQDQERTARGRDDRRQLGLRPGRLGGLRSATALELIG